MNRRPFIFTLLFGLSLWLLIIAVVLAAAHLPITEVIRQGLVIIGGVAVPTTWSH